MNQQNEGPSCGTFQGSAPRRGRGRAFMFHRVQTAPNQHVGPKPEATVNTLPSPSSTILSEFDDPQQLAWVQMLEKAWNLWKKGLSFQERLFTYYEQVSNPYMGAIYVTLKAKDFRLGKVDSLAYTAMEEFEKWIQPRKAAYAQLLQPNLKAFAFNEVCKQRNTSLIKMVCDIYECSTAKEMFLEDIKTMLRKKDYKEACLCATFLGLNSAFSIEDFLVPLLFQDKLSIVETFLKNDPDHQKEIIFYLDNLVGSQSIRNEVDATVCRLDIPHCKMEKLYYKPLSKLITRLVQQYGLKTESCPNLSRKKKRGVLLFLLKKRFEENQNQNLSSDSWREMVSEAVENDSEMLLELIQSLDFHMDYNEALFWVNRFHNILDIDRVPINTRELYQKSLTSDRKDICDSKLSSNHSEKLNSITNNYHKLSIPAENIIIINDAASFAEVLKSGFNNVSLVGLDTEWKPVFCATSNTIALLQIATSSHVYIFDTISLQPVMDFKDHWNHLGEILFGNTNIIKLGFSLSTDLNAIKSSLPFGDVKFSGLGYLDLASLWKRLINEFSFTFPFKDDETGTHESLTKLVTLTVGKSLCKQDQFSNWEKRPLRQAQLEYAALDAFCLIEVYKVLEKECKAQSIPFNSLCQETMSSYNSKKPQKKKGTASKSKLLTMAPSPIKSPVSVHHLKFVVDTMISGLGMQLRKFGIDTLILQNGEAHTKALEISQKDDRMVLTRGQVYEKLYGCLTPGHCYRVESEKVEDQLAEVLEYYKIKVEEKDIFTRCQQCNYNEFSTFTRADVKRMLVWTPPVARHRAHCYDDYEDDDFDDYGGFSDRESSDEEFLVPGPSKDFVSYKASDDGFHENLKAEAEKIPMDVVNKLDKFYSCNSCNKFYWDGTHLEHELAKFSNLKLSTESS